MKISLITATFNSEETIADTLRSVSQQDHNNIEHLIIDGLSTDSTLEIIRGYPHVFSCISEKDKGIYDAMNKGIALASGEVVGILNSDDFYADSHVLSAVATVFKETGCDALYGDLEYVDKNDVSRIRRQWKSGEYSKDAFKWGWMPPHPTFFVKRAIYESLGVFNREMGTAADYELMLRFIHKHHIRLAYLPRVIVKMRTGGASNVNLKSRLLANREDRKAWEVNGLHPFWFTLYLKPLRKVTQFI